MGARVGSDSSVQVRPRAVVWTPRSGATGAASSLLENLTKRGADPLVVTSDLWAMAHACVMGAGTLLILCEPKVLKGAAQVALALRKYAPGVVVYAFEPGSPQLLREINDQDLVDWGAPGKPAEARGVGEPGVPRVNGKPFLRLTGEEDGGARPIGPSLPITEHVAGAADGPSGADVLSADELAMLLGRNGSKSHEGGGNAKGDQR